MMKTKIKKLTNAIWIIATALLLAGACPAGAEFTTTPSGLLYEELVAGSGEAVESGKVAVIHFRAWLDNKGSKGVQFYDTRVEGQPVAFKVGTDNVMPGWNIGVAGMRVGGQRRLMIPAKLGYGATGVEEVVPPNADLIFEVELVDVR